MRVAVIGATGRTGRQLVEQALGRGHRVTVLCRDPARFTDGVADRVRVVVGEATDPAAVRELLAGTDAVLSTLGPTSKERDLHTRTAPS